MKPYKTDIVNTAKVLNNYLNKYHDNMIHELTMGDNDFNDVAMDCEQDLIRLENKINNIQNKLNDLIDNNNKKLMAAEVSEQSERLIKGIKTK